MPLVALGHSFGNLESSPALDRGILSENHGNLAVFKSLDDTGDDKEKRPQADLDAHPEHDQTNAEELLERYKELAEAGIAASADLEESVRTDSERNGDEQRKNTVEHRINRICRAGFFVELLNDFCILRSVLEIIKSFLILENLSAGGSVKDK